MPEQSTQTEATPSPGCWGGQKEWDEMYPPAPPNSPKEFIGGARTTFGVVFYPPIKTECRRLFGAPSLSTVDEEKSGYETPHCSPPSSPPAVKKKHLKKKSERRASFMRMDEVVTPTKLFKQKCGLQCDLIKCGD